MDPHRRLSPIAFIFVTAVLVLAGSFLPGAGQDFTGDDALLEGDGPPIAKRRAELPFGFEWGQTRKDAESLLTGVGVVIASKQEGEEGREVWDLEGFIKPLLIGTKLYFTGEFMDEIEMMFGSRDWSDEDYTRLRRRFVDQFNKLYTQGELITNERELGEEVKHTLLGYQWRTPDTLLRVFDFTAKNENGEKFRTVSVHYNYFDPMDVAENSRSTSSEDGN